MKEGVNSNILSSVNTTVYIFYVFFFSSRRRHTRFDCDWSSDVCSSDLIGRPPLLHLPPPQVPVHDGALAQGLDPRFDLALVPHDDDVEVVGVDVLPCDALDRKSTRLNSSHSQISYAVFCLKKKKCSQNRADAQKHLIARRYPPRPTSCHRPL